MVRQFLRVGLYSVLYLSFLFSAGYVTGFLKGMNTSPPERLVFRFSTCIPEKAPRRQDGVIPKSVRTASRDLLDKLSDDSRVVTIVDDGRVDWEWLIGEKNFTGSRIGWHPSTLNGLTEALGGAVSRSSKWDAVPLDCKNSRWSLDISNVQRATPMANIFRIRRPREPLTPTTDSQNSFPVPGCTSVYVLSREAWEKIVTPDLESMKGLSNTQCWARGPFNSEMSHDPGLAPNRGAPNSSLTNSTNSTSNEGVADSAELPERQSWVPPRQDSLLMEPVASQESNTIDSALQESMSPNPAYNTPENGFEGERLCYPVHYLETVFEEDEDSNLEAERQLNSPPATGIHENMETAKVPESQQGSWLLPKCRWLRDLAVFLFFTYTLRMLIQRHLRFREQVYGEQECGGVEFSHFANGVLFCVFNTAVMMWIFTFFDLLRDPGLWEKWWRMYQRYATGGLR